MKIPTYQEMIKINNESEVLEKKINLLLEQPNGSEQVIDLLLKRDVYDIALRNQRIFILIILAHVGKDEIANKERRQLFHNRKIDDLISLYQTLILLLRRIEFDFPSDYSVKAAEYIFSEQISATAVMGIIDGANIIIQKEKVRDGIIQILSEYVS